MSKPTTTRTLNPLPFHDLEPKRFEDLVRQLAYDFRQWRMLEATGRTGSDDGYDARGFERSSASEAPSNDEDETGEQEIAEDRLWLIQCKRERTIPPTKMRHHLEGISDNEARKLYGIIFAAACDFSKSSRDVLFEWARARGISEVHIWGKAEIEDLLYQPKNDHLLFAYFGISLQIRKRSIRSSVRSRLSTKRKVLRLLGAGDSTYKEILLRDPDEDRYPYRKCSEIDLTGYDWLPATFSGNHLDCIKIRWRHYWAFLDKDGVHWDAANILNVLPNSHNNYWIDEKERDRRDNLDSEIRDFWMENIEKECRATANIEALIKYDDIIDIDEYGDNHSECPHVFLSFRTGLPPIHDFLVDIRVPDIIERQEAGPSKIIALSRIHHAPLPKDRVQIFPNKWRRPID